MTKQYKCSKEPPVSQKERVVYFLPDKTSHQALLQDLIII